MNTEKEAQRHAAVNLQIKEHLDAAVNDRDPAVAMMRAILCAELYVRNEKAAHRATGKRLTAGGGGSRRR